MTDDEPELRFVETTTAAATADPDSGDVIPGRSPRPPVRWSLRPSWLVGLLAIVLAAGIGIGYLVGGHRETRTVAAPPSSPEQSASLPAGPALAELPQLRTTGNTCYGTLADRQLMVGIEIVNDGLQPVVLRDVQGTFPLNGLRQVDSQVGQCDNNSNERVAGHRIEPSATAWITLTVVVLVPCPGPLPVMFHVATDGVSGITTFPGFPDLGDVPYPG
ncbi:MAG TPA: hypothetical protein VE074_13495, partial [Jatrophihabitantaceae bacterium]|nr:hypothetical protein [Jatrophihabitantaceae bacterium]